MVGFIRRALGEIIIFFDWVFSPHKVERGETEQKQIEQQLEALTLYQFRGCPFCIKVRRTLKRLSLPMQLKDAMNDPEARNELDIGGGRVKVPCLRIEEGNGVRWMYESNDIIAYLEQRFPS